MDVTSAKLGRSFRWFNATQFLGVLNDNIFRLLVILFLIRLKGREQATNVGAIVGAIFVVPFLLFSAFAGKLADRHSKRNIIVAAKVAEVVLMVIGCVVFMLHSAAAVYAVFFLMAAQSAFFGPSKYGIVPELVATEQLSRANGLLKALTYSAIVIGAASGIMLSQAMGGHYALTGLVCVAIAAVGLMTSLQIQSTPAAGGGRPASILFVRDIWRTICGIRPDKELLLAVIAAAYFLLLGAFVYINVIPYGMERLGLSKEQSGYLYVVAAVGIGAGALWAGKLSGRHVEFGVVPLGALGLTFSSMGLGFNPGGLYTAWALTFLVGASAGLFIVPIQAFIQLRSPSRQRGEILAAAGFLGWLGVLLASGLIYVCSSILGMSAAQVFVLLGGMTLVLAVVTIILLPDFLIRFVCLLFVRFCYRIEVVGIENVPTVAGALLVSNHASYVDPLLLLAAQQRRIRFLMYRNYYNKRWLTPFFKLMGVIPVAAADPPRTLVASLRAARAAMADGFLVGVFAEGAMTRTGMLRAFKRGLERITRGTDYNIVPVYIAGLWGSIFSYYHGKPLSTLPRKFRHPVSIRFGQPMEAGSPAGRIRQRVSELSCEHFDGLKTSRRSLAEHFVRAARKNWRRRCISDSTGKRLDYGKTLVSAVALSREIDRLTIGQEKIGVALPPSVGAVIANLAIAMLGKVSVNLNYVASEKARELAVVQCGLKCIISSRRFVEKVESLARLPDLVFLEDIVDRIEPASKLKAYLRARFVPRRLLTGAGRFSADDLAAVIFTSGSSGRPKGVMLSHHNLLSNMEALRMVFKMKPDDNVCAVLPFFHSFGFTCTLWLPLISGVSATYSPNPLDGRVVGRNARQNHSTLLFATPTFLRNYVRKAEAEDFDNLRFVVVGAEKLTKDVADSFERKFGIRPVEGYGATELSPVVSLNLEDTKIGGVYQVGNKPGAVGHPIPGVAVKIVDIETGEPVAVDRQGLLMVKGPNLMLGYLNMGKETAEAVKGGWYNTGDVAKVDEDGFLTLTDRLWRFSKIGGEMIPHAAVEQAYLDALGTDEQVVAVTSVPGLKKSEDLVVLYLERAGDADKLHRIISESSLPNIFKPRRDNYIKIESMPVLGSGKLDVMRLREIAAAAGSSRNR
ncbi:MAG: acyl-[ACP]--phospholipid O-acyltransferase [Planctomycetota bacterium]|jgi:acyl-[acyl-carrier-protein]-phospholipid O-acyltransferase/long-chain-fatty-acid--[acyl-carrier-protein] ligase